MKAQIIIWSAIGHTPVTGRKGSYCDELVNVTIEVTDIGGARQALQVMMAQTEHAQSGYFNVPEHHNQNTRSAWIAS